MTPTELNALAEKVEALDGPSREVDCLSWCALNGITDITYPEQAQEFSKSGRVEGRTADGGYKLLGWIDPGKVQRNWSSYGGDEAYPAYTASLDQAMTLVPEGWNWMGGNRNQPSARAYVENGEPAFEGAAFRKNPKRQWFEVVAATPALALCSAALKARAASLLTEEGA